MTKTLQQPIAACIVERKKGIGYDVKEWLTPNSNLENQRALDIIAEIEDSLRDVNVNSSLICRRIDGQEYLIVGTVWSPPDANDCFLVKWYDAPKRTGWIFVLFVLLIGLVLGIACVLGVGYNLCDKSHVTLPVTPVGVPTAISPYETFVKEAVLPVLDAYDQMLLNTGDFKIERSTIPRKVVLENMENDPVYKVLLDALREMQRKYDESKQRKVEVPK